MPVGGMIGVVIAEVSGPPSAVAFGGAMVAGMALVVAVFLPSIRRLEQ
jgi:zinc transporter ZupT